MPLEDLPLESIQADAAQPRKSFYDESLEELAASIRERGVLEPIVVRPMSENGELRYQIVMGERRFRASKLAGRATIPAIIREMSDEDAAADALLENFQRENLNAVEKAHAVRELLRFQTMDKTCRTLGVSETTIRRLLELLELPEAIQQELIARPEGAQANVFGESHARALQALNDDPVTQTLLVAKIKNEKLSVAQLEQIITAMVRFPAKRTLFLHVSGGVGEQITRSMAAQEDRKKPYRAQTAQDHVKSLDRRVNALAELLDDRVIEHLSLEELNRLLALATVGSRQIEAFCNSVRDAIENQDLSFSEVYTYCPLCGRVELVGGMRCSVCRTVLRRCYDCMNYDDDASRCTAAGGPTIDLGDAEDPTESSRSYKCRHYKPKIKPRGLNLPVTSK